MGHSAFSYHFGEWALPSPTTPASQLHLFFLLARRPLAPRVLSTLDLVLLRTSFEEREEEEVDVREESLRHKDCERL